jgi:hypothetical protein
MRRILLFTAPALLCLAPFVPAQPPFPGWGDPVSLVDSWYRTYLGRSSLQDPYSSVWVSQLQGGTPAEAVLAAILASDEYYNRSGSSIQGFIQSLFRDVLGRQPTPGEFDFWMRRAYTGDRKDIAYQLLTQNPGRATIAAPPPPPPGIPDRDRNRWRDRYDYDYRRPYFPYRW